MVKQPPQPKKAQHSHVAVGTAGGVGASIGVLVVMFMPASFHVFTATEASMATMALGVIFSALLAYIPKPKP